MNRTALIARPENDDDIRRRIFNALLAVAVFLAAMLIAGCGDDDRSRDAGQTADTAGAGAEMPGSSTSAETSLAAQSVTVTLKEFEISMPTILKPGPTTFDVSNAGTTEHSFEIEGNGQESKLQSELEPGKSAQMEVELLPGTYKAYCPVGNHEGKGMTVQITVQP